MNVDALLAAHFFPNVVVIGMTAVAVGLAVLLHYEGLNTLNSRLIRPVARNLGHRTVVLVVFALIGLHVGEICLFGLAYWLLIVVAGIGGIDGAADAGLLECFYLSATTYSTVGFGDVAPTGPIRFLAATESLIGLMLITWSASFTFLEMSRRWRDAPGGDTRGD